MKTVCLFGLLVGSACNLKPDENGDEFLDTAEEVNPEEVNPEEVNPNEPLEGYRKETPSGLRHMYSQLQAWTSDGQYFLTVELNTGEGVVLDVENLEEVAHLGHVGHRWIPGTHKVLMFDDQPQTGAAIFSYDIDTHEETEIVQLGHPGLRAGRSHEETDSAGRWVAVYIDEAQSGGPRIATVDLVNQEVMADVSIDELGCEYKPN